MRSIALRPEYEREAATGHCQVQPLPTFDNPNCLSRSTGGKVTKYYFDDENHPSFLVKLDSQGRPYEFTNYPQYGGAIPTSEKKLIFFEKTFIDPAACEVSRKQEGFAQQDNISAPPIVTKDYSSTTCSEIESVAKNVESKQSSPKEMQKLIQEFAKKTGSVFPQTMEYTDWDAIVYDCAQGTKFKKAAVDQKKPAPPPSVTPPAK